MGGLIDGHSIVAFLATMFPLRTSLSEFEQNAILGASRFRAHHQSLERTMTESRNPAIAALLLRVSLGTMFIAHALLKYFVFTLPGNAQFFESLGLPGPL